MIEMFRRPLPRYLAIAAVLCLAQTAVLAGMIEKRASVLRSGTEILLKTAPVDPRDLLRGDYVVLSYDVSTVPVALIRGDRPPPYDMAEMDVRLKPGPDGFWVIDEASFGSLPPVEGTVVMHTQPFRTYALAEDDGGSLRVDYGIERYYVPEGEGRPIEEERNEGAVSVAVRVGSGGLAQIRELRIDGKPLYEEPLY